MIKANATLLQVYSALSVDVKFKISIHINGLFLFGMKTHFRLTLLISFMTAVVKVEIRSLFAMTFVFRREASFDVKRHPSLYCFQREKNSCLRRSFRYFTIMKRTPDHIHVSRYSTGTRSQYPVCPVPHNQRPCRQRGQEQARPGSGTIWRRAIHSFLLLDFLLLRLAVLLLCICHRIHLYALIVLARPAIESLDVSARAAS